ncbi:histidine kinase/DNA gyrase B/HSP90-like ATPase [Buttiauxella sp. JUb87]|nr:histidine kinase/DNA gyrase B/HSP90-like ATPase [Buttiauxella sp. JUb87]
MFLRNNFQDFSGEYINFTFGSAVVGVKNGFTIQHRLNVTLSLGYCCLKRSNKHASQLTQVSLREETLKTAEYVEPSFAEKQLHLDVEGDVTAHIDRRLFHRSLANLLENSARHSLFGSTVTIRLSEKNNQACIEVSNPGDPIAPEHLHRLFERFYRVDTSRARSDTHHGLGLSIVRAVAIMHQGDVFARSEGGINTFGLTFAMQADKTATKAHSGTEPGLGFTDRIVRGRQPDVITSPIKSSQVIPLFNDKDALHDRTFTLPQAVTAPCSDVMDVPHSAQVLPHLCRVFFFSEVLHHELNKSHRYRSG